MSKSDTTHFHFDFGGITLELSGEREFVEKMYKQVMRDVAEARSGAHNAARGSSAGKGGTQGTPAKRRSVWVHRCSDLMRKIYMATPADVSASILGRAIDSEPIGVIYIDKGAFNGIFPEMDGGQTMWAEFTAAGKAKLAEATRPAMQALSPDVLKKSPGQP